MRRALGALALLALLGAAPAPGDLTAAAACTFGEAETDIAFRALPLVSAEDDSEADESGAIFSFASSGATVWGTPVSAVRLYRYINRTSGDTTRRYHVAFPGEHDAMRARLLAAHARTACDRVIHGAGARECEIALPGDGAWERSANLIESGGRLELICMWQKLL